MERNIQKIGIINFVILFIAGGISVVLSRYSNVLSGEVGAVFFGAGFIVTLAVNGLAPLFLTPLMPHAGLLSIAGWGLWGALPVPPSCSKPRASSG